MQCIRLYDEHDSTTTTRVTIDGERQPVPEGGRRASTAAAGGSLLHAKSDCVVQYWVDEDPTLVHLVAIDNSDAGAPPRQVSIQFPAPSIAVGLGSLAMGADDQHLILVWVTAQPAILVARLALARRDADRVEMLYKECTAAQLGAAGATISCACVLKSAATHGHATAVAVSDGDAVWVINVHANGDTDDELWLAGGSATKKQRGWLLGRTAETAATPIIAIRTTDTGAVVIARQDGTLAVFDRPRDEKPSCTSNKLVDCAVSDVIIAGRSAVVVGFGGGGRRHTELVSLGSGTRTRLTPPHGGAILRSAAALADADSPTLLWDIPAAIDATATVSMAALCAASSSTLDPESHQLLQTLAGSLPPLLSVTNIAAQRVCFHRKLPLLLGASAVDTGRRDVFVHVDVLRVGSAIDRLLTAKLGVDDTGIATQSGRLLQRTGVVMDCSGTSFLDDADAATAVPRAILNGIAVVANVDEGVATLGALINEALATGARAPTLTGFATLAASANWCDVVAAEALTPTSSADMRDAIEFALALEDTRAFCSRVRRFLFNGVTQNVVGRVAALVLAHVGWTSTNPHFMADRDLLARLESTFALLSATMRVTSALSSLLPAAVEIDRTAAAAAGVAAASEAAVLRPFLSVSTAPAGLLARVVGVAVRVLDMGTPQGVRACLGWCAPWAQRFPLLQHFSLLGALERGRTSGGSSSTICAHSIAAAAHLASCDAATQAEVLSLLFNVGSDVPAALGVDLKVVVSARPAFVPQLLRVLHMRRLLTRVDAHLVSCAVSRDVLEPSFTTELAIVQHVVREHKGPQEVRELARFVKQLAQDTALFLVRGAIDDLDFPTALWRLTGIIEDLAASSVDSGTGGASSPTSSTQQAPPTVKFHVQSLVAAAVANGRANELAKIRFNNAVLANAVAVELYSHCNLRAPSSDRADRERRRVANALSLFRFLTERHAYGAAARVVYDVGVSLRSSPQCTTQTLMHALTLIGLAVDAVELIPAVAPPPGAQGFGGDSADGADAATALLAESSLQLFRNFSSIAPCSRAELPLLRRQLLQVRCERKLLHKLQRPMECTPWSSESDATGAKAVVRELLTMRLWKDALELSRAWSLPISPVLRCYALDLLQWCEPTDPAWGDCIAMVVGESSVSNNFEPLRDVLCAVYNHRNYRAIPHPLKDALRRVDPSGFIHCCLQQQIGDTMTVKESVVEDALDVACDYLTALKKASDPAAGIASGSGSAATAASGPASSGSLRARALEERNFAPNALITATMLDRAIDLSRRVVERYERTEKSGVTATTYRVAKQLLELTVQQPSQQHQPGRSK